MELLTGNWEGRINALSTGATVSAFFISPFVNAVALPIFRRLRERNVPCRLVTRLHKGDFWKRVSRCEVLRELVVLGVQIRTRKRLHAKAYFFDGEWAVISSA